MIQHVTSYLSHSGDELQGAKRSVLLLFVLLFHFSVLQFVDVGPMIGQFFCTLVRSQNIQAEPMETDKTL